MSKKIDKLILNNPYEEPQKHWLYERETRDFSIKEGRRPAGYIKATPKYRGFDDPGIFVEIELANKIRARVRQWREAGYPGVTGITRRLIDHWCDLDGQTDRRFFFCQLEAIETLIWLTEAPASERVGIEISGDGGTFERWCSKMATGSGKTVVMAMIIAWNFLNKITNPMDTRFSKHVLVVAPGLTIKSRLQVLQPSHKENYYDAFNVVPAALMEKLRRGRVLIHNWHTLSWDSQEKIDEKVDKGQLRSVDKRKRMEVSLEAYARNVLGEMAKSKNIIVINDEAHHAWRVGSQANRDEEATVWVGGLDRIHKKVGILRCFDLSATPFSPSGRNTDEEDLFSWIVSDFGLSDAIESGLVKTPRVVVRDDSERTQELKSRLYHIYMDEEVKDDLNQTADATAPLPDLVTNAYYLLGGDWLKTRESWQQGGRSTPPVMITVANRTETSARIKYAFDNGKISVRELCERDRILQIDSRVLNEAEAEDEAPDVGLEESAGNNEPGLTRRENAERLRQTVDTIGQKGKLGEQIQNVISVGMLSEGWDARTVTHIMGLRAFSSQLLCEQVVGRGLRRVSYEVNQDGLFDAEYVNVFGVPFTFLPHEEDGPDPPPSEKTRIEPVREKIEHQMTWPNVIRVDRIYRPVLSVDWSEVEPLELNPYGSIIEAEMAEIIAGKPHARLREANLGIESIGENTRLQTIAFRVASSIYHSENHNWKGDEGAFIAQLVRLAGQFIQSDKLRIKNRDFSQDERKRKVLLILNMNKVVQHFYSAVRSENAEALMPVFDKEKPVYSTSDARPWFTAKPCEWSKKSHINYCVYDSAWEASEAYFLEKTDTVDSFVKNEHLGFFVNYLYQGVVRRFYPDFIIRLCNGEHLILEVKGQDDQQNQIKREFLGEWVEAVNRHEGFGKWHSAVSFDPSDLEGIIEPVSS